MDNECLYLCSTATVLSMRVLKRTTHLLLLLLPLHFIINACNKCVTLVWVVINMEWQSYLIIWLIKGDIPNTQLIKFWGCCHQPWWKSSMEPRNELICNWSPLSTSNCKGAGLKGNYRFVDRGKPWMIPWDLLNCHVQGMSLVCTLWQKHWCA